MSKAHQRKLCFAHQSLPRLRQALGLVVHCYKEVKQHELIFDNSVSSTEIR